MSTLIAFIVEFLASVATAAKARQQAKAAEELPRGEAEIKAIGDDVAAIKCGACEADRAADAAEA
jgi:hypothetical protein